MLKLVTLLDQVFYHNSIFTDLLFTLLLFLYEFKYTSFVILCLSGQDFFL